MPAMNHQDAHELIATLRYAVNESFEKNQKLSNFNPEAHNLCIAHCTFNNAPPCRRPGPRTRSWPQRRKPAEAQRRNGGAFRASIMPPRPVAPG